MYYLFYRQWSLRDFYQPCHMFDTKLNTWFIGVFIVIEAVTWAILMMRKEETNYHRFTIGAICACVLMIVAIVSVYAECYGRS